MAASTISYSRILGLSSAYANGWIRPSVGVAIATRSIRDIDEDRTRLYLDTFILPPSSSSSSSSSSTNGLARVPYSNAVELTRPIAMDISPSGGKQLLLKHGKDDTPIVELRMLHGIDHHDHAHVLDSTFISITEDTITVNTGSVHGKFIGDSYMGGIAWSSDERYVAYVANVKDGKKKSFFDDEDDDSTTRGNKFDFKEDWGEKYDGIVSTCICILDCATGDVKLVTDIDISKYTVGQPSFVPFTDTATDIRVVYTAWSALPRKLGMVACYQRESSLFVADLSALLSTAPSSIDPAQQHPLCSHTLLTPSIKIARSARFSKSGRMIFVGSQKGFATHGGTTSLFSKIGINDSSIQVVVDVIRRPCSSQEDSFPGLYIDTLPRQPFLFQDDDSQIVLSTFWGSKESLCRVDLSTGDVQRLDFLGSKWNIGSSEWNNAKDMSCQLLDCSDGKVLFAISSPSLSHQIGLLDVANANSVVFGPKAVTNAVTSKLVKMTKKHMNDIDKNASTRRYSPTDISNFKWKILRLQGDDGIPFEAILVVPPLVPSSQTKRPMPLIVVPHGGPHAVMTTQFFPTYAFVASYLQAAVLHVNFRGSTGFGQDSIESLAGMVSVNDVLDVVRATRLALDEKDDDNASVFDESKTAIVGGSHGGFLGAHLVGQHPSLFKAACLRNPVINIPGMATTTDIPDWCQVEVNGLHSYDFSTFNVPSADDLSRMLMMSPVAHVNNVITPTLICLGLKDRRVPSSQGLEFYHLLRARGVRTKLLCFPDDVHAIDKPSSEAEHWVAIVEFIESCWNSSSPSSPSSSPSSSSSSSSL